MPDVTLLSSARAARFAAVQNMELAARHARASLPAEFAAGQWSVASGDQSAVVTVSAFPDRCEAVMFRVGNGVWQNAHLGAPGQFTIAGLTNGVQYAIQLRAFNATGGSDGSAVKNVTPA